MLESDARAALSGVEEPAEWRIGAKEAPMPVPQLRSLRDFLEEIPDFRKARGRRYSIACYLTIRGAAGRLSRRERVRRVRRPAGRGAAQGGGRILESDPSALYRAGDLDLPLHALGDAVRHPDQALRAWSARHGGETPVAMDGKDVRGASKQVGKERRMMVAAVDTALVLGQVRIGAKTNEIPAVRELSRQLDLAGRVVTVDAMHAQHETARCLTEDCEAHYVVTGVKDNQPTIRDDLAAIDWRAARWSGDAIEKGHGRIETRRCAVLDPTTPKWRGRDLFGRRHCASRIVVKTGETSREVAFCLTSLGAGEAGPEELLNLVRDHWQVENRVHYVRDFSYDEDRCRASVRNLPRNLAR